ncbi:hypothetical protein Acy02nite_48170 [Actinoplanes cyaneus]|uniref:Fibronectin type-III domain-containing protein n=1 Tax=Actinoplanes cyaneus TaxID=52696 RepID=A0A919MD95_9ACTN|nr:hypothetical protein [Actinoplanes cyaneus]MCW2138739.1 hypothetical protein [Actinoplanes cyaneus]GID66936.1 hypothetical protein Acy02nite_48170 [Actinoplanes cyaneus]
MFDGERYREEVLDPARKNGNTPPADLLVRYAVDPARPPRGAAFDAHISAVYKYWQQLGTQRRVYQKIVEALNAAHQKLKESDRLTAEHFLAERRRVVQEIGQALDEIVKELATDPVVAASALSVAAAPLGGAAVEATLRDLLGKRRVRVVDELWPLPDGPPPKGRAVQRSVRTLGLPLSLHVLAGEKDLSFTLRAGLRVGGRPLTVEDLDGVRARTERRKQDDRKTATDDLLTNLGGALRDGSLDRLVLWELIEAVRPAAGLGKLRVVAREATRLGLQREEAEDFALAVLNRGAVIPPRRDVADEIDELLGGGSLRAAERLLPSLPANQDDEVRERVRAATQRVDDLAARAQREIAAGRTEIAAELLTIAVREAADDTDLAGRLRTLAPPPVPAVRAGTAAGDRVAISWTPSPARTGGISYQVVRTRQRPAGSAGDGEVIGRTDGNEVADTGAPAGDDLHYTVFATRSEGVWSPGATAGPVSLLPEVTDVGAVTDESSVRVTWTSRADATGFTVVREPGGTPVRAGRNGFADEELTPGVEYRYLIRVNYPAASAGVTVTAMPQAAPTEVPDLAVEPLPGQDPGRLRLAWTRPDGGDVTLRSAAHRPRWNRGAEITGAELTTYGKEVLGRSDPGTSRRAAMSLPMPAGRVFVTAFSVGGGRVIVGPTVAVTNIASVTDLRARRVGPVVRLSWTWPDGVALARVRWWPEGGSPEQAEQVDCWQRAYRDDGGLQITTGIRAVRVEVSPVSRDGEGETVGSPAGLRVGGSGVPVNYRFTQTGMFRKTTRLELVADQECPLPDLVVVQSPGRVVPLRPDQGTPVARIPAQRLEPGRPVTVDVPVQSARGPYRLGCFVDDHTGDGSDVVLKGIPGGG